MAMTFKRKWDFDQGNKPVLLNDMTQDREVIEVLRDAIAIAARGTDGDDGRGIVSFTRTSGNGAPGTADTYTVSYTDSTTSTLTIYNGKDGLDGAGTQLAAEVPFDPALAGMTATDVQAALEELHSDIAVIEAEPFDEEAARDAIGAALVAGENITIAVDDVANTITIAAAGGGGGAEGVGALASHVFTIPAGTAIPLGSTGVDFGPTQVLKAEVGDSVIASAHIVLNGQTTGFGYINAHIYKDGVKGRAIGQWVRQAGQPSYHPVVGVQADTVQAGDIHTDGTISIRWSWNIDSTGSPALFNTGRFYSQVVSPELVGGGGGGGGGTPVNHVVHEQTLSAAAADVFVSMRSDLYSAWDIEIVRPQMAGANNFAFEPRASAGAAGADDGHNGRETYYGTDLGSTAKTSATATSSTLTQRSSTDTAAQGQVIHARATLLGPRFALTGTMVTKDALTRFYFTATRTAAAVSILRIYSGAGDPTLPAGTVIKVRGVPDETGGGANEVVLLEAGQTAADVPAGTPVGTIVFEKG